MTQSDDNRLGVVKEAARVGGTEALRWFRTELKSENKVDADTPVVNPGEVVTDGDRAAQQRIVQLIEREYPDDAIVGEEGDELKSVPESGVAWVIDPIDGTYNFARGDAFWATSIAVVRDGKPIAAANAIPAIDDLYLAGPDGVTRNDEPMSVSDRPEPKFCSVAPMVIPDYGDRESFARGTAEIARRFGNIRRYGSAQVTCSFVASGIIEGGIGTGRLNPWDSIAGAYLVDRAGGMVTGIDGAPWTHRSDGLVVSNGRSHDDVVAVARLMAGDR